MKLHWDTVLERDIDLLIIEEFVINRTFAKIFTDQLKIRDDYEIEDVFHSKRDIELGESDILIILNTGKEKIGLYIENKIDAQAMAEQCKRYFLRAEKDRNSGLFNCFAIFITAPRNYLKNNSEAKKYPFTVSYEIMRDYFTTDDNARNIYKISLLEYAIEDQKRAYQYVKNPNMAEFCKSMSEYQKIKYPILPKGSVAWWPYFESPLQGTSLILKALNGRCDLTFHNETQESLLKKVYAVLLPSMRVIKTGKSASVCIDISPIDMEKNFDIQIDKVDEALKALDALYKIAQLLVLDSKSVK